MIIDDDVRYRAVQSRDPRFDGKFFTGVVTTGIYCRPVCPAKTPNRENVRFFSCAAAAEEAGFRPCRRCRPETAPGTPVWNGTMTTVSRGARLIEDGFLTERSTEELAAVLGMGPRHLRRLFVRHLGASPKAIDQRRRSHFAAMLLSDTLLPVTAIALESGFRSIRQFNDAFKKSFGMPPTDVRRSGRRRSTEGSMTELRLAYRPPLDWGALLDFMARRAVRGIETVNGAVYRRSVRLAGGGRQGTVRREVLEIADLPDENCLMVRLNGPPERLSAVVARVRRMFDLAADPLVISEHLRSEPTIAALVERFPGIRIPGAWDPFEAAIRAVVGQQITVAAAIDLLGEVAELCGTRLDSPDGSGIVRLFPTPEQLAAADLTSIRMPGARKRTLTSVARAWIEGGAGTNAYAEPGELIESLRSIPGVGPWTAEYTALRGFLEPDAFPSSDIGIRTAIAQLLGLPEQASAKLAEERSQAWRPWRGYAAVLLWKSLGKGQEEKRR